MEHEQSGKKEIGLGCSSFQLEYQTGMVCEQIGTFEASLVKISEVIW